MPDPENFDALARWLDQDAVELITDIMARHTRSSLEILKTLVKEKCQLQNEVQRLQRELEEFRSR